MRERDDKQIRRLESDSKNLLTDTLQLMKELKTLEDERAGSWKFES